MLASSCPQAFSHMSACLRNDCPFTLAQAEVALTTSSFVHFASGAVSDPKPLQPLAKDGCMLQELGAYDTRVAQTRALLRTLQIEQAQADVQKATMQARHAHVALESAQVAAELLHLRDITSDSDSAHHVRKRQVRSELG
jgi:hypothetical protein